MEESLRFEMGGFEWFETQDGAAWDDFVIRDGKFG